MPSRSAVLSRILEAFAERPSEVRDYSALLDAGGVTPDLSDQLAEKLRLRLNTPWRGGATRALEADDDVR